MLVLERKRGEGLTLLTSTGEVIQIGLVSAQHGRAKIGIKAPEGVVVVRDEIYHPDVDHVTATNPESPPIKY